MADSVFTKLGRFILGFFLNAKFRIQKSRTFRTAYASLKDSIKDAQTETRCLREPLVPVVEKLIPIADDLAAFKPKVVLQEKEKVEELLLLARNHDAEMERIDKEMSTFSYASIIADPLSFSKDDLQACVDLLPTIAAFNVRADKYQEFYEQVLELSVNFDLIQEQFRLAEEYKKTVVFDDVYLDNAFERSAEDLISKLERSFKEAGKNYYSITFPTDVGKIVREHNVEFVMKHSKDPLFDSINGKSLDADQRKAVLTDELSTLIVAGAGSGKTLTICGKVQYLLERKNVDPRDILLLSYSKKSADDLSKKVKKIDERLCVGTFHKLGLDILKSAAKVVPTVEEQYDAIIENYFRTVILKDHLVMGKVLRYLTLYSSQMADEETYSSKGELYESLKEANFTTLKDTLSQFSNDQGRHETIKKELVKSQEELILANWYFINGIEYTYEAPYCYETATFQKRQYTPDFFLNDYNIYHEHYGVNENGEPRQYRGREAIEYKLGMAWKRGIHAQNKTICIETYSYQFRDETVFEALEKQLKELGVEFKPLSDDKVAQALQSIYHGQDFKSFIVLLKSFISLYKAKYPDATQFEELKNAKFQTHYERQRATLFLDIAKAVYCYYNEYIASEGKIDFDVMILGSKAKLNEVDGYSFKYIIVDEFQDISFSRMEFLRGLVEKGGAKVFAVGDDWQAIYRFSGCDLDIFTHFESYFGPTSTIYIPSTHRNSQELQNIAGPFVKKDPALLKKVIKSDKHLCSPVKIVYSDYDAGKYAALLSALEDISEKDKKARVLLLGRNNRDIEDYTNYDFYEEKTKEGELRRFVSKDFKEMTITFSTVHGSKGLEEDYVVILNGDDANTGFPNKIEDDPLLNLVLSSKSNFEYAEERRLFYVALTRTRSYVYIIVDRHFPSCFVSEIIDDCTVLNADSSDKKVEQIYCPDCKKGKLVLRTNGSSGEAFYGCSNYPYCKYTIHDRKAVLSGKRCPICGDFLIKRKGKRGYFYGCHNYPDCRYTEEIIPEAPYKKKW